MSWLIEQVQRAQQYVPVFGVVVYTSAHPYVRQVLRDRDFWEALDAVSGTQFAVFAIRSDQRPIQLGTATALVCVDREISQNEELLPAFDMTEADLPALVIFALHDEETWRTVLRIDETSADGVYQQLRRYLVEIRAAVDGVTPENIGNAEGVLTAINHRLGHLADQRRLTRIYQILKELRDWVSAFTGLAGT